jgi:hypothetical protein
MHGLWRKNDETYLRRNVNKSKDKSCKLTF